MTTASPWPPPAPGAAPLPRMITAQAALETRILLRNGEQLLLTLIIPVMLLLAFTLEPLVRVPGPRVDFLVPGVIALAVISTAFTSQAIATGFERRYGVLKRLGATPLPRSGLIAAKTATVIAVELVQTAIIIAVGLALGWHPHGGAGAVGWVVLLVLVGTAAFSGLGLLLAGLLRAEATLAVANLIYLVLLGVGGVIFPLTRFPSGARTVLTLLPSGALSDGLRSVLGNVTGTPLRDAAVLAMWAAAAIALAARTFRWE
ncbi:MAG TPA: ABC transporter permease [Streptosporangiaceae bacterium]|nr:ABC transporter permease [Streptosporangiaceae bacterium]